MALLKTVGLCKYFGGLKAVNHVDMEVQQGQVFGIIGPNGAGKTTFFNLCAGTIPATEGEIWFDGKNITGLPPPYGGEDGHRQNIPEHPAFPEHDRAGKRCGRLPHPHKHQYAGCRFGQRTPEKHRKRNLRKRRGAAGASGAGAIQGHTGKKPALRHPAQGGKLPVRWQFPPKFCCWTNPQPV